MAKLGRGRMPHFGSQVVDETGLKLIGDWIASLGNKVNSAPELKSLLTEDPQSATMKQHLDNLLSTTSGAIALVQAIDTGELVNPARQMTIDAALAHPEFAVRDLFERFAPEEKRSRQLASAVKPSELLSLPGNAENGRKLFFQTDGVTCRNCHRYRGQGGDVGPDLSEVVPKRTRAQVLESILEPSKSIDPKFTTYLIETKQGMVHQGLLVAQSAEAVTLKDSQNRPVKVAADDIEMLVTQRTSLMPELLVRDWQPQQIADLIEFLMAK
jgi:putative heme-binding domain-containing protein